MSTRRLRASAVAVAVALSALLAAVVVDQRGPSGRGGVVPAAAAVTTGDLAWEPSGLRRHDGGGGEPSASRRQAKKSLPLLPVVVLAAVTVLRVAGRGVVRPRSAPRWRDRHGSTVAVRGPPCLTLV